MNPAGWQAPAKAEDKSWRAHREIKGYAGSSVHRIVADEREYATGTGAADESDGAGGTYNPDRVVLRSVCDGKGNEAPAVRPGGMIVSTRRLADVRQLTAVGAVSLCRPQHLLAGESPFVWRVDESLAVRRPGRTGSSIDHLLRRPTRRWYNPHSATPPRMKGNPSSLR